MNLDAADYDAVALADRLLQHCALTLYSMDRGDSAAASASAADALTTTRELIFLMTGSDSPAARELCDRLAVAAREPAERRVIDGRVRVLLVDDYPDIRSAVRALLEETLDVQIVGEAGNGLEAIEMVRTCIPDLVLLDLAMPVMDGLTALKRIVEDHPDLKIVVLSGYGHGQAADAAMSAGAAGYVEKGSGTAAITGVVRELFPACANLS